MKEFLLSTQTEALGASGDLSPASGTTREDVINRFELLLRTLAYAGWEESIHSGQHGENYFCILDEDGQGVSVTLDDAGNYTVSARGNF